MLKTIDLADVQRIARIAKAAREARDDILDKVRDEDLDELKPLRGEHNATAGLGLDPLPEAHPARAALWETIVSLSPSARAELRAVLSIGQGDYAAKEWERALAEAKAPRDEITIGILMDEVDLHDYLMKGLYGLGVTRA